jgi:Snf7
MVAESKLLCVRDSIEKNKQRAISDQEDLMTELRVKARACKGGTKEQRMIKLKKLVPMLQKCKRYRQQTALAGQQLGLLDAQINAFENGRFQKEMTDTLRASVVAMKTVGISEEHDMDNIMLDMEDTIQQQNQIADAMSITLVNSMDDSTSSDDALMRELMALAGDDEDVEVSEPTNNNAIPTMSPITKVPHVLPTAVAVSVVLPTVTVDVTEERMPSTVNRLTLESADQQTQQRVDQQQLQNMLMA